MQFRPFSELATPKISNRNLPHWETPGATYFLTYRLSDSIPAGLLRELEITRSGWLRSHGLTHPGQVARLSMPLRREFHGLFTAKEEHWLHQGHGTCILRTGPSREHTESGLRFFDGTRYALDAFVIMPNHVHALILPIEDWSLSQITSTWKKNSAREINATLHRTGSLWQKESYDHIVRDLDELENYRHYIAENPVKLHPHEYTLGRGTGITPP